MATTTVQPLPYPLPGDPADGPAQIKALAEAVENRVVMRFPSLAARDAALPSGTLVDGMVCHVAADSSVYIRSGGAWALMWHDWRPYTATLSGAAGTVVARYARTGATVTLRIVMTLTAAPTASLQVSAPLISNHAGQLTPIGSAYLTDASASGAGSRRIWDAYLGGGTTIQVMDGTTGTIVGPAVPWTWAAGDTIAIQATYETA